MGSSGAEALIGALLSGSHAVGSSGAEALIGALLSGSRCVKGCWAPSTQEREPRAYTHRTRTCCMHMHVGAGLRRRPSRHLAASRPRDAARVQDRIDVVLIGCLQRQ